LSPEEAGKIGRLLVFWDIRRARDLAWGPSVIHVSGSEWTDILAFCGTVLIG
jgi:hypothetical protein